jgi:tetratricopeptide (TPR) repeat protein
MIRIVALCVLFASLVVCAAYADSAKDLNTRGYRLYKEGRYEEALDYFQRAIDADASYALAHYNYACTLGVLRDMGPEYVCRYDAYKWRILDHLEESARLDPDRLERMKEDPDLTCVHDTFRYQLLLGLDPTDPEDALLILQRVSWYSFNAGAFGPAGGLNFKENGLLDHWVLDATGDEPMRLTLTGIYSVTDDGMEMSPGSSATIGPRYSMELTEDGRLFIHGFSQELFIDDPRDCEA